MKRSAAALTAAAESRVYMCGQFAELCELELGAELLLVVVVAVFELDFELDDDEPLAALAIAAPPPAMAPVTASVRIALWRRDLIAASPPLSCRLQ